MPPRVDFNVSVMYRQPRMPALEQQPERTVESAGPRL